MTIVDILFLVITLIWIGEFFFFKNRSIKAQENEDTSSFPAILYSVIGVIIVSIISRELQFLALNNKIVFWLGLLFYGFGVFLRLWGIIKLGKQFTRNVNISIEDKIIKNGPFRFLRHPLYSGLLSTLIGINFYTGSIIGLIMTLGVFLPLLLKRIRLEEEMLFKAFGYDYKVWAQSRSRLVPFVY